MFFPTTTLLSFSLILALALFAARWRAPAWLDGITCALESRWAPTIAGVVASLAMTWVWGSLHQVSVIHDEAAYVLQARIYAAFNWTAPGRPIPEFFDQYHVFVTPHLFAKYWPGHALALVPGIWLGLPGLVPIVSIGVTAAVAFTLVRHVTNAWVALLAWTIWITAPGVLSYLPSFLSHSTSCALWMVGWWALLRWRDTGARRWLLLLAACIGWGGLTRPFTWVLYAIPVAIVVLPRLIQRRAWADLGWASAVMGAFGAIFVLWCLRTTGQPFLTPYTLYTRTYLPADVLGFGLVERAPLRALDPDMQRFTTWVRTLHTRHTLTALPHTLRVRLLAIVATWPPLGALLSPFIALALPVLGAELAFALLSTALLVCGYLVYAHAPIWTVYYLEVQPVLATLIALGAWRLLAVVRAGIAHESTRRAHSDPRHSFVPMLLLATAFIIAGAHTLPRIHRSRLDGVRYQAEFRNAVASLAGERIIVFVRYAPSHSPHNSLIVNEPDFAGARAWIVYDRGEDNRRLLRLAPERAAYLFDEAQNTFSRMELPLDAPTH